jgi:hypothetical protein
MASKTLAQRVAGFVNHPAGPKTSAWRGAARLALLRRDPGGGERGSAASRERAAADVPSAARAAAPTRPHGVRLRALRRGA